MSKPNTLITGAGGQLGKLVINQVIERTPANRVAALVRSATQAGPLNRLGVDARIGDYTDGNSLDRAFGGIERLLFISSNDLVARRAQHRNVIDAAKRAGVKLIAYTSLLHADRSPLGLARDHRDTEADLRDSGVPFVVLRNGWYTENYTQAIAAAITHGTFLGSAGNGRIASAARRDYAEAAAAVLLSADDQAGRIHELAGESAYTLPQFVAEIAKQTGQEIVYRNLPQEAFRAALQSAGLPAPLAALLADSDVGASQDGLYDDGRALNRLIGRPTTPFAQTIAEAVAPLIAPRAAAK
jgi:NAD(P)H dehydrogenase (quinone)